MDEKDRRNPGVFLFYKSRAEQVAEAENGPKATLFFEFLADLSPHLAFDELVETFDEVLSTTTIKKEVRSTLLPLWLYGHTEGSSKYMRAAFAPLLDEEISFRWPWFDDNPAAFLASGLFPETWQAFASFAADQRRSLRAERVTLLLATVSATTMRRRDAQQYSPGSFDRWTVSGVCGPLIFRLRSAVLALESLPESSLGSPGRAHCDALVGWRRTHGIKSSMSFSR